MKEEKKEGGGKTNGGKKTQGRFNRTRCCPRIFWREQRLCFVFVFLLMNTLSAAGTTTGAARFIVVIVIILSTRATCLFFAEVDSTSNKGSNIVIVRNWLSLRFT